MIETLEVTNEKGNKFIYEKAKGDFDELIFSLANGNKTLKIYFDKWSG
jgi:hypothetical protein